MTTDKTPTAEERADLRKLWEPHTVVARLLDALDAAEREATDESTIRRAVALGMMGPLDQRAANALADEVAVLVRRKVIDSRSPAADALLDYRNPPSSDRADRLAALESELAAAKASESEEWAHDAAVAKVSARTTMEILDATADKVIDIALAKLDGNGAPDCPVATVREGVAMYRADLARVTAERDEAIRHRAETNEEIRKLHAMIRGKGFSVEDSVALHDFKTAWLNAREENERLTALLDERTAERDARERERDAARSALVVIADIFERVWNKGGVTRATVAAALDAARKEAGLG